MKRCWLLLLMLCLPLDALAGSPSSTERSFSSVMVSGVDIQASVLFSEPGNFGVYPIRVRIKNATGRARRWHCAITASRNAGWTDSYVSHADLAVEDGETKTFELSTLLLPEYQEGYNAPQSVRIRIDGYGVTNPDQSFVQPYRDYKLAKLPYLVLSPEIALRSGSVLSGEFASASKAFPAVTLDLKSISDDWRQLTGTPIIWLSLNEWLALRSGQREAIANWMLAGGSLVVFSSHGRALTESELGMPFLSRWDGQTGNYGLGNVKLGSWNGVEVTYPEAFSLVPDAAELPFTPSNFELATTWRLVDRVPAPELNAFLVSTLLFVYAVIVGPVNLGFASRRGARQLIFITTPIIAVASCLALFALIVMKDGFGGWGARNLAVMIEGSTNRALVTQENLSRTGILLDDALALPRDYLMFPLPLLKQGYRSNEHRDYEVSGNEYTSGWVGNRSRQAQLAFGVVPTRARISFDPQGHTVTSSIETELKALFVMDEDGTWWRATKVLPGKRTPLTKASTVEFVTWSQGTLERSLSSALSSQLSRAKESKNAVFFAEGASDAGFGIPVLTQFAWEQVTTIFYGPL